MKFIHSPCNFKENKVAVERLHLITSSRSCKVILHMPNGIKDTKFKWIILLQISYSGTSKYS